ncbi:capsular polysaccharide biosynthesis protein [Plastorhodobacter daqingensis]|uniref:Capsular polysaccharide biosynthesis protein n=1 Tax=Plastorhodobacter daqingensis TaxID=1387281 RepID=A0ABW2UH49_9RHOB
MTLAGLRPRCGLPGSRDLVAVWGNGPRSWRGEAAARRSGAGLLRIEDAFLRSVRPGRAGDPPLGLLIDSRGAYYDARQPSDLEHLLAHAPLDDPDLLARADRGIARIRDADLSKYNTHDPALDPPESDYVLIVDQVRGDASIRLGGADADSFTRMLDAARAEHPGARIVIKTHPETIDGYRAGHFQPSDGVLLDSPVSPWRLLAGARAVYTVSSQLGFEAILAGHRPCVFGQPFYAGWGLSDDRQPLPRRSRNLAPAQLFAAAMILYPRWYDPCRDRLCSFEDALNQLEAEVRAFREDRRGHVALGMRLWKRAGLQRAFGQEKRLLFENDPARAVARAVQTGRDLLVWAGREPEAFAAPVTIRRVEDGFLRSRGLGAALVPALSLVTDDLGIYYDPSRESRLERLIAAPPPPGGEARAKALVAAIVAARLSKYNLAGAALPPLPEGYRILVPGQVEDDASILRGGGEVRGNLALLERVRRANPGAVILYKPHPDVEAGLRPGAVPLHEALLHADAVLPNADPIALIDAVAEIWTITSTLGFEALLRGKPVTCLGAPFYAGWGLTRDLGPVPARRTARPSLDALAHATLIAYPRCFDPVTGLPCPPEVLAERLATGTIARPGGGLRILSKLQGLAASYAHLWR